MFKPSLIALALSLSLGAQANSTLTKDNGAPVGDNQNSITAGLTAVCCCKMCT